MKKKSISSEMIARYVFLLPGLIMFCFSIAIPFFMGINIAFTDWNGITKDYNYVGIDNFIAAFLDPRIGAPLRNSLLFAVIGVIGGTIFSLGMALMVNYKSNHFSNIARTIFFMPVCFSSILAAFIWKFIYKEVFTALFGTNSLLGNTTFVIPAIVLIGLWNSSGINMLIYLSGLKSIPTELYEAARVDGASAVKRFGRITLPLLAPSFTVCITLTLTSWFREFGMTLSATGGGPGGASRTLAIYIYENLYNYNKAGYGQAVAFLFALLLIILGSSISSFFRSREVEM